ncbi:MAG: V-type ATP synthase subunit E family protein [Candidatus Omnitrophota bacterium]
MSLESILAHILNEADARKEGILKEARLKAQEIIQQAGIEAEGYYRDSLKKENSLLERQRKRLVVNARLKQKKKILEAKQGIIGSIFDKAKPQLARNKIKKEIVSLDKVQEASEGVDFYLAGLRLQYENEIAGILFK